MSDKVLVTGAAGFIGSHLTEFLVEKGYDVRAFVHYNALGRHGWLDSSSVADDIEIHSGDIRDFDSVSAACQGVSAVLHLASLIGIPYSYVSPLAYVRTNVEGGYNVAQACLKQGIDRIIHTSTSEVYGTALTVPISEEHPLQPQSPYSASKISADQMALSYHNSFELPLIIARPFNTYGPRQSARAIIPTIITQILAGKKTLKLGNLTPTRDLNFVKDTAKGFHCLLTADLDKTAGKVFNIGTGKEISMGDLVSLIAEVMGADIEIEQDEQRVRKSGSEVERLLCDPTRLKELAGWAPDHTLRQGLAETVKWLEGNMHLYRPDVYNV